MGRETYYTYDKAGNMLAVGIADNNSSKIDNNTDEQNADNESNIHVLASYTYDKRGRIKTETDGNGNTTSYTYDRNGNPICRTDALGGKTTQEFDPIGRVISVTDALGNETAYTYDSLDNIASVQRAEGSIPEADKNLPVVGKDGHVTLYDYDLSGQLITITDALGQKEYFSYDQYGRLKTKTDRDGYITDYEYNNAGSVTKVNYADGRSVALSYNALNQLNEINDWLGKTTIENDALGRLTKVTDFKDRTVAYEYNEIGAKTKLTYPDGRAAVYSYDEFGRLSSVTGNGEETRYTYDELGRLVNKNFANGVTQGYSYLPGGNLESMTSTDREGILDKYFYSYNNSGLISGISRERRDLAAVSGQYDYQYDEVGRLTRSSLNGQLRASYEYDAFGNRISLVESDAKTTYRYDALDRLVEAKELNNSQAIVRSYDYDKRGNQTNEYVDGLLNKTFTFDATNMLSKVVDTEKGELENQYNGLGFRVATTRPEERIEYLCDLSRDCYNMLERTVNGETENFIYDKNVISMSKAGDNYYYLQDELGSPMYMTGTDGATVSSYAFDDFGRGIDPFTGRLKEAGKKHTKHGYTTEGNIIQPFAFTGYQEDEVSGLKFAQARFYSADNGRFVGVDLKKGIIEYPSTLNQFSYCINNPYTFVDRNGQWLSLKDFNVSDGLAVAGMAVATTAAVAGGIILATATAPVSVPLIAAGAVVGAGVAYDASVISDWKNDKHANLQKAVDNAAAGAMIGGTLVAGAGAVTAGGATLETVGTAVLENKDVVTGTVGGLISMASGNSFGSGFWSSYVTSKTASLGSNPYVSNFFAGGAGSLTNQIINDAESGQTTVGSKKSLKKIFLNAGVQCFFGGGGDCLDAAFQSTGADTYGQLAWYVIHDLKNQGMLGEASSYAIDKITEDDCSAESD